jgi:hypothetical protein
MRSLRSNSQPGLPLPLAGAALSAAPSRICVRVLGSEFMPIGTAVFADRKPLIRHCATTGMHVGDILGLRSYTEMGRVAAEGPVARMKYAQVFGDVHPAELQSCTMSKQRSEQLTGCSSIAKRSSSTQPGPATLGSRYGNQRPEPVLGIRPFGGNAKQNLLWVTLSGPSVVMPPTPSPCPRIAVTSVDGTWLHRRSVSRYVTGR